MASFATAVNCIDGRVQEPVIKWLKQHYNIDYVDMITEPGPDKVFSERHDREIEEIHQKVLISINAHDSQVLLLSGHYDCAANPHSKEGHIKQIQKALSVIEDWKISIRVIGVWINEDWQVELIDGAQKNLDNQISDGKSIE